MNGPRGRRGFRGERGERGSTGERGAERGQQGEVGARGERGKTGAALPRRVTAAFVVLFLGMAAALGRVEHQRAQRVDDQRRTERLICERQQVTLQRLLNEKRLGQIENRGLDKVIEGITALPDPDPEDAASRADLSELGNVLDDVRKQRRQGIKIINDLLDGSKDGERGKPLDCAELPSQSSYSP